MQMKLIFTRNDVQLASFWKWGFLEFGSDLLFYWFIKKGLKRLYVDGVCSVVKEASYFK